MMLVRRLARPMLAGYFVARGVRLLRNPAEGKQVAERVAVPLADRVDFLPKDPETLVRLNAGLQAGFGLLLASGRFPRLSATILAGSALPTTMARHPFWEVSDQDERAREQSAFFSELSVVGGLLLAAVDTEGDPSLAWRTRRAARSARRATGHAVAASRREAKLAGHTAASKAKLTGLSISRKAASGKATSRKAMSPQAMSSKARKKAAAVRELLPV